MKFYEVVLINVPFEIDDNDIETRLKAQYREVLSAKRIRKYPDQALTPLIRVRISTREIQLNFLSYGCKLGTGYYRAQPSRKRLNPRRCYRCQEIGAHLARDCRNATKCMKCSDHHNYRDCHARTDKCANCGGHHSANSTLCPRWIEQTKLSRKHRSGVVTLDDLTSYMDNLKSSISDMLQRVMEKISAVRESVSELKTQILVSAVSESEFELDVPKTPEMTSNDGDVNASYHQRQADEPSAIDQDHRCVIDNATQTCVESADPSKPGCDSSTLPDHTIPSTLPREDDSCDVAFCSSASPECDRINSVNSATENENETEIMIETENETVPHSDTVVDATKMDTSVEPLRDKFPDTYDDDEDATYREFFARVRTLTKKDIIKFQNQYNPFMGEVLFRYSGGTISRMINVISMDGGVSNVRPCELSIKSVKKLCTNMVTCCPFHHLSSDIRDTVDKNDMLNSLKRWRTKNVNTFCDTWQSPFFRDMEEKYGQLDV